MTAEIRNCYPLLIASGVVLTASMEGALWTVLKGESAVRERAMRIADVCWWGVLAATLALAAGSLLISPELGQKLTMEPWAYAFPVVMLAGLFGVRASRLPEMEFLAFFFSCVYLAGAAATALFGAAASFGV